jgi:uncharacterized coiled-coil DUF342 family protein
MTEAFGPPTLTTTAVEPAAPDADAAAGITKLTVLPPPPHANRDSRPVTNLGKVFGQFAELQQQIAEQVSALEDSVHSQKQDVATAVAQLPELRERINWLIASFYEQSKKDESTRDRLDHHDVRLESLEATIRTLQSQQNQWEAVFDEVIASLVRAKAAMSQK